jgi:hypothetical protein
MRSLDEQKAVGNCEDQTEVNHLTDRTDWADLSNGFMEASPADVDRRVSAGAGRNKCITRA